MARRVSTKQTGTPPSADVASGAGDVFDVRKVRQLVELMNEHDLSEIDLRQADQRVRLRRGPETITVAASPSVGAMPMAGPVAGSAVAAPGASSVAAIDESKFVQIKSPMVGTFYTSPNPESPPFVKVGDQVGAESTVCVIEAMKVFNEIPAECSGKIAAVLVANGDPVEFGQALFRVEPNA